MPNILVKIPKDAFPGAARAALVQGINEAAASAEQIPADPRKRALCWILIDEVEPASWTCGGMPSTNVLPCMAVVHLPAGVLDAAARGHYVQRMHSAFERAQPADDQRRLASSIVLHEVADGNWGVNGAIWPLSMFAKMAGFRHLQHLVAEA